MRICFIADARSSIARSWISYFVQSHDVHVLSTHPCPEDAVPNAKVYNLHWFVDTMLAKTKGSSSDSISSSMGIDSTSLKGRLAIFCWESWLQPAKAFFLANRAKKLLDGIQPDLLHALRIPIEGEIGGLTGRIPFMLSVWGNDFTLYAERLIAHRYLTRKALSRASAIFADCDVDLKRARAMGARAGIPMRKVPGCGGIDRTVFHPGSDQVGTRERYGIAPNVRVVLNPRGFRRYIRQDTFLKAIPNILRALPNVVFVGVGLRDCEPLRDSVNLLEVRDRLVTTGPLSSREMADLYRLADVSVSPSEHDGTPNTLLEAMACGCIPVCSDLPSIREWIRPGENGLLFHPGHPEQLADAIIQALSENALKERALAVNQDLIDHDAEYYTCMSAVEEFYEEVLQQHRKELDVVGAASRHRTRV